MPDDDVKSLLPWCELCWEVGKQTPSVGKFSTDMGTFHLCEEHRGLAQGDEYYMEVPIYGK